MSIFFGWLLRLVGITLALIIVFWVSVGLLGYPQAPATPEDKSGFGFRLERGAQHIGRLEGSPWALGYYNSKNFARYMEIQEGQLLDLLFRFTGGAPGAMIVNQLSLLYLVGLDDYLLEREKHEILGLSEGSEDPYPDLGPRYSRIAAYHAIHELSQRFAFDNPLVMACSALVVGSERGADGHAFLARNFDFEGGEVFDEDKIILAVTPKDGYGFVAITWSGMAGVLTGMNEHGLALSINAGGSNDYRRVGTPTTLLMRRALEKARTIDEAVTVLTSSPSFVTDVIAMADGEGDVAVLELTPDRHALRRGDILGATNQLETPELKNDSTNLERLTQTTTQARRRRLQRIIDSHEGVFTKDELIGVLRDRRDFEGRTLAIGHRHSLDALIATHSVVFDTVAKRFWVSTAPHTLGPYYGYDLKTLLASKNEAEARASFLDETPPDPLLSSYSFLVQGRQALHDTVEALRADDLKAAEKHLSYVGVLLNDHPTTLRLRGKLAMAKGDKSWARRFLHAALSAPPEYEIEATEIKELLGELGVEPAPSHFGH